MSELVKTAKGKSSKSLRLTARIIGTLWILICLMLFIGYYFEGLERKSSAIPAQPDIFGIFIVVFMGCALVGLVIAWWNEGLGGFISFIGFLIAGTLLIIDPKLNFSPIFFIVFVPTVLYLAYWKETRNFR
jgi:hypothetical protein